MAENNNCSSEANNFLTKLDFQQSNMAVAWNRFKLQFNIWATAKGIFKLTHEEQIANLIVKMGSEAVDILQMFNWTYSEQRTFDRVVVKFDQHFQPAKNIIYERLLFNRLVQGEGQPIHKFITAVQTQAANCEYGGLNNDLVRDRIVVGVTDNDLRNYLIDVEDLNLELCIRKAKQYTTQRVQSHQMANSNADNVDEVKSKSAKNTNSKTRAGKSKENKCKYCCRWAHPREQCPAKDAECHVCKQKGHYGRSKVCGGEGDKDSSKSSHKEKTRSSDDKMNEVSAEIGSLGLYLGSDSS